MKTILVLYFCLGAFFHPVVDAHSSVESGGYATPFYTIYENTDFWTENTHRPQKHLGAFFWQSDSLMWMPNRVATIQGVSPVIWSSPTADKGKVKIRFGFPISNLIPEEASGYKIFISVRGRSLDTPLIQLTGVIAPEPVYYAPELSRISLNPQEEDDIEIAMKKSQYQLYLSQGLSEQERLLKRLDYLNEFEKINSLPAYGSLKNYFFGEGSKSYLTKVYGVSSHKLQMIKGGNFKGPTFHGIDLKPFSEFGQLVLYSKSQCFQEDFEVLSSTPFLNGNGENISLSLEFEVETHSFTFDSVSFHGVYKL